MVVYCMYPGMCLQETSFILYDLRFDCRYVVKVQPVSEDGAVGEQQHVSFMAPTCTQVEIVGDMEPECKTNGEYFITLLVSTVECY